VRPKPLDPDEMRLWQAFLQAALLATQSLDRALAEHELTLDDYETLVFLSAEPERRLAMSDLAARTLSPKSRLTYRVDRLEAAGYVERVRCRDDARRVWATLTPRGFALLRTAWPTHLESVRKYVVDPVFHKDLPAATRALERMVEALRADES